MALDLQNAQRLGLGNSTLSINPNASAISSLGLNPTPPPAIQTPVPTSPITQKPVGSFGSAAPVSTGIDTNYQLIPGENIDSYNKRITAYRDSRGATSTPAGGYVATNGSGVAYSSPNFSINTSGAIPSSVLGSTYSGQDVTGARKSYADYVQGLAQANQYSPEYLKAYQNVQNLQTAQAELKGNLATGNVPGDTQGFAEGFTNRQLMGAGAQEAFANVALQAQALARQGDIAGAKALVDAYGPQSVSPGSSLVNPVTGESTYSGLGGYQAVQGIQTVNNLAQSFPDAGILPTDDLNTATQKAAAAPSFTSKNLVQVTLPGGGIQFVNRNQLQTNSDGTYTLVGSGEASTQKAASNAIAELTKAKADTVAAISTADANFPLLLDAAKKAGVNNSVPLVNQLQQAFARKVIDSTALASLNTLVPSLQTEYARIISRGGTVDDNTRNSAKAIVDGTYSLKQLQTVYNTVKREGQNVIKGYDDSIAAQQRSLSGAPSGSGLYSF